MTRKWIEQPPAGLPGWREVWAEDRRYPSRARWVQWLGGFLELFHRSELNRQRDFNVALLDMLADLKRDISSLHSDIQTVHQDLVETSRVVDRDLSIINARGDALLAALDRKVETLAVRMRDLSTSVIAGASPSFRHDFVYRRLEDSLRGSEKEIRASVSAYVDLVKSRQPVLDIGCGRGEFLALCAEEGIEARGFDCNERSVADLRARGLAAELGEVPGAMTGMAAESFGSVVASHVVEHLPGETLVSLFAEVRRILRSDGIFIIETPNAESMQMTAVDFWRDPTHLTPRHPAALVLMGREFGFSVEQVGTTAPYPEDRRFKVPESGSEELRQMATKLNDTIFADQNLLLVLKKN
jgi:2-polyprenyl-3-methyl-5-hydroxy-6-metoxy-1,4-benzoquinol methylase